MGNLEKPLTWGLAIVLMGYLFIANCDCGDGTTCPLNSAFNIESSAKNGAVLESNETEEVPSFKVSLGVMPDYMFNKGGMRIDAVTQDRPGYKAGLIKGDIVIKLGDHTVEDMMGYMKALSKFKPGDSTSIVVKRDQDTIKRKVAF